METSITNKRNPVKRIHSLNRQKEYVTPTKRDVLCPNFNSRFIKTGEADVVDDFYGQCHNNDEDLACDYRERLTADVSLCKRYWKEDPNKMEYLRTVPEVAPAIWQQMKVRFDYERPFRNRTATVELALIRQIVTPVDLGDFLSQWRQWYESGAGNWVQTTNASGKKEILNTLNQGGRSFWYNPTHVDARDYTHEYFVQARGGDDDTYGSVFRYNPIDRSFYTFEWDSGGMGIKGMAVYRNVYVGSKLTKTLIVHNSAQWGANSSRIHKVNISVIANRVKVVVQRLSGSTYSHIATMEFLDTHADAPFRGAWGPLTASQPNTYFWDLNYTENVLIDSASEPLLKQEIPLSYVKKSGSLHIVSEPMSKFFTKEMMDNAAIKSAVDPAAITSIEYWLRDTNVLEGVQFSNYNYINSIAEDSNTTIAMSTFNYDEGIKPYEALVVVRDRTIKHVVSDTSTIDKTLTRVTLNMNNKRLFDRAAVKINGVTVFHIPNITSNEYMFDIPDGIQLEVGDAVSVEYTPNEFEMEFYRGAYIDTHDKIFKIDGNKLGWHHIPLYEQEKL